MSESVSAPVPRNGSKPSCDGRFIWQSALAIDRIVKNLGQTDGAFGLAVYIGLCSLSARNKGGSIIEATVQVVAQQSGLGYNKTLEILDALEERARVIAIERRPRRKGELKKLHHVYTLLACKQPSATSGKPHSATSGRLCAAGHPTHPISGAEIPIDSAVGRESKKEKGHPSDATALPAAGDASALASESTGHQPQAPDFEGGW